VGPSAGRDDLQINFLPQPHIEKRLVRRAAHSQFCETDFEPDYSETPCSVSYARCNFEPGSSDSLCSVSYTRHASPNTV